MTRRIAVLLLFAFSAVAQAPSTFKEGVLAFEKREWAKAERLMRETIAVNPRESEGTVSIAGSWFETYVPHYFLARALAKQGKCEEALKEFAETERQGVTPGIEDFARHLRNRGGCGGAKSGEKAPKVIGEVEVPFEATPAPLPQKRPSAGAGVPADKPGTGGGANAGAAPLAKPGTGASQGISVEDRARLTTGIRAYLEGQYDIAVRVLDGPFSDRAASAEAALFRAAARDALYRLGGEQDAALRAAVEIDLRIYRALKSKRKPDPRLFSPRFIAMIGQ